MPQRLSERRERRHTSRQRAAAVSCWNVRLTHSLGCNFAIHNAAVACARGSGPWARAAGACGWGVWLGRSCERLYHVWAARTRGATSHGTKHRRLHLQSSTTLVATMVCDEMWS
jgi:hypothetical protein